MHLNGLKSFTTIRTLPVVVPC